MDESKRQAELAAIFKDLLRALRLIRELQQVLESIARRLTAIEEGN